MKHARSHRLESAGMFFDSGSKKVPSEEDTGFQIQMTINPSEEAMELSRIIRTKTGQT